MGLRETLEAATPGPWRVAQRDEPSFTRRSVVMDDGEPVAMIHRWSDEADTADARLIALAPELAAEVLELRERHREAMALALDWGNWTRDFLLGDNIDPGDRADLTALVARLDQLGKEQT